MWITKNLLDIYRISSYIFLYYFLGWYLERYFSLNFISYCLIIFILIFTQFLIIKKKNFLPIFFIFLLLGNLAGQNRHFVVNIWLQNSLDQFKSNEIGFFLLKIKWKLEGKDISIFLNRDELLIPSRNLNNLNSNEKLVFSIDYMPLFIVYTDENNQLKKKNIIESSSNAGIIYADDQNNFIFYNSQTGNLMQKINFKNEKAKTIWKLKGDYFFHHWGDFFDNKIYIPGRKYIKTENKKNFINKNCDNKYINQDTILIVDFNSGKIVEEINIFDLILSSEFSKLFYSCINPIHLNDIEIIKKEDQLQYFENAKVGDYLISLRNINTILLIDHETKEIKWSYNKDLVMQHSPQITDKGTLLIFNNLGSKVIEGQSRIDEIEIKTKKIVGIFDGVKNNFYSEKRGRIQFIDGRIFIQESQKSNLFELICEDKFISDDCKKKNIVTLDQEIKDIFQSFAIDFF